MSGVRYEATAEGPRNDFRSVLFDEAAMPRTETQEEAIRRIVREELERLMAPSPAKTGPISCRECKEVAAQIFGVTVEQISGNLKFKLVAQARQAAIWCAVHLSGQHLSEVARNFNRDHTTILYSVNKCQSLCGTNGDYADKVDAMRRALRRPA